ncbi:hypothetical protein ACEWY4_005250 [Coilia grayii]|uniref:Caspase recruitment domain-containing protein n=1 Tax=Coilia grayii TaxID=363190 RepID=A0ABD1KHT1_9TELE
MPYASDKLEKGFLRQNRPRIAREVKATDMLLHLPCLTTSDMEEVEAAFTTKGNIYAMGTLLSNLVRRQNWPEHFIRALEECEHPTLAQEMSDAYEALKQPSNQKQKTASPSTRQATATPAHSHAPSPAVNTPASPPASLHPPPQAAEPVPLPKLSPPPSTTGSPFPSVAGPQAPTYANTTKQPAFQPNITTDAAPCSSTMVIPETSPSAAPVATVLPAEGAQGPGVSGTPEPDIPHGPAEVAEPCSLAGPGAGTGLGPWGPLHTHASESRQPTKAPIQETSPPSCKEAPLQQEPVETSEESLQQATTRLQTRVSSEDTEVCPPPGRQNTTPPPNVAAAAPADVPVLCSTVAMIQQRPPPTLVENDLEEEFLSKPGVLRSEAAVPCSVTTACASQEPDVCSVTSDDLEISTAARNSTHGAVTRGSYLSNDGPQAESSARSRPNAAGPCPEHIMQGGQVSEATYQRESVNIRVGGSTFSQSHGLLDDPAFSSHHMPTEDYYDSQCSDAADQSTLVHVLHVSHEPSVQNWDGQPPRISGNAVSNKDKLVVNHSDTQLDEATRTEQQQPTTDCCSLEPQSILGNRVHFGSGTKTDVITEKIENTLHVEEKRHQREEERNENEQKEVPSAVFPLTPQNVPLIPAAAVVIGVILALVFALKRH